MSMPKKCSRKTCTNNAIKLDTNKLGLCKFHLCDTCKTNPAKGNGDFDCTKCIDSRNPSKKQKKIYILNQLFESKENLLNKIHEVDNLIKEMVEDLLKNVKD